MGGSDLWRLFDYDELLINVRQTCYNTYCDILSKIRIGLVTDSDVNVLQSRKIHFKGSSCDKNLNVLCNYTYINYTYINQLPVDIICLLLTCYLYKILNTVVLDKIDGDEIILIDKR